MSAPEKSQRVADTAQKRQRLKAPKSSVQSVSVTCSRFASRNEAPVSLQFLNVQRVKPALSK